MRTGSASPQMAPFQNYCWQFPILGSRCIFSKLVLHLLKVGNRAFDESSNSLHLFFSVVHSTFLNLPDFGVCKINTSCKEQVSDSRTIHQMKHRRDENGTNLRWISDLPCALS